MPRLVPGRKELAGSRRRPCGPDALSPGPVETPGLAGLAGDDSADDFFAALASSMPGGRAIKPEEVEVAAAATFLASDDSSGINGIDLQVDGGFAQI